MDMALVLGSVYRIRKTGSSRAWGQIYGQMIDLGPTYGTKEMGGRPVHSVKSMFLPINVRVDICPFQVVCQSTRSPWLTVVECYHTILCEAWWL